MRSELNHERLYRGTALLARLAELPIAIVGVGALGANLAETLARQGAERLILIDRDRVEASNLCTQPYARGDVGGAKTDVLASLIYEAVGVEAKPRQGTLDARSARKLLKGGGLIIDCLDNTTARAVVQAEARRRTVPCLHVGLSADYAEIIWDAHYRVPDDTGLDLCDYPLARNLVMLAVSVAAEAVLAFVRDGAQRSHTLTLGDLAIRPVVLSCS